MRPSTRPLTSSSAVGTMLVNGASRPVRVASVSQTSRNAPFTPPINFKPGELRRGAVVARFKEGDRQGVPVGLDEAPGGLNPSAPYPANGKFYDLAKAKTALPGPRVNEQPLLTEAATRVFEGEIQGCETVAVDSAGVLIMLDKWGYVWEAAPDGDGGFVDRVRTGYTGPARPLGVALDADNNLVICNVVSGLLLWDRAARELRVLSNIVSGSSPLRAGTPLNYANDVDVAADGTVYFSTSSDIPVLPSVTGSGHYDTMEGYFRTMYQGKLSGMLLAYSPETRATTCLADGLYFANGVAVAKDGSFVAVVETCSMSVYRYWLQGPKAGCMEPMLTNLPGFPDGIAMDPADGTFYIAVVAPPTPVVPLLKHRAVRTLMAYVPQGLREKIIKIGKQGITVQMNSDGEVLRTLTDPTGSKVWGVSAVTCTEDRLFFGCISGDYVSYVNKAALVDAE